MAYIDVLPHMNSLLRLVPPNTKLATTSGVCRKASSSPLGACTRTPLVSIPPQPQLHHTLPSVSQRTPSEKPGLKSANTLPPLVAVPSLTTSKTMIFAG